MFSIVHNNESSKCIRTLLVDGTLWYLLTLYSIPNHVACNCVRVKTMKRAQMRAYKIVHYIDCEKERKNDLHAHGTCAIMNVSR